MATAAYRLLRREIAEPMEENGNKQTKPAWRQVFGFFAGFKLATALLLLLMLLTWLGTLEQIDRGLHGTLKKYFGSGSLLVIPEINGRTVPLILPGCTG